MPGSREEDYQINNVFSLYDLQSLSHYKNPYPGGHEIYNFGKSFLGNNYYTLCLYESCPGVEMFLKKYIDFTLFTPKLPSYGMRDHETYSFLSNYPINATYEKMLTHDGR